MKISNLSFSFVLFDDHVAMGIARTHQEYLIKQSSFKTHLDISKQNRQLKLDVQRMQVQQPEDEIMNDNQDDMDEIERDIEEVKKALSGLDKKNKGLRNELQAELECLEHEGVLVGRNNN